MSPWVSRRRGQGEAATQAETHAPPSNRLRARPLRGAGSCCACSEARRSGRG